MPGTLTACWHCMLTHVAIQAVVVNAACLFDSIKPLSVQTADVSYATDSMVRVRRDVSLDALFRPIRLRAYFAEKSELSGEQGRHLRLVINETIGIAAKLFSVIPAEGPLLLSRSSCRRVWQAPGINAGKCASLKGGSGRACDAYPEYCTESHEFQIPDDHLVSLSVWNETSPEPVTVCQSGQGLDNTDYIIYVNSAPTQTCFKEGLSVIAYATYCQVDSNSRPIAGYINICPLMLSDDNFDFEKVKVTALHELFHALGFSVELFKKFKNCRLVGSTIRCEDRPNPISSAGGVKRLVSPTVVRFTQRHFAPPGARAIPENFGPILQTLDNATTSHWDAAFMHSSLMTPSISLPDLMVLDNITLAFFEDTGWYKVNYSLADKFVWGKGKGFDFGLNPGCEQADDQFLCQESQTGCHYLHTYKGTCVTNSFLHNCRVYRATPQDSCQLVQTASIADDNLTTGEEFRAESRCFLSNLTSAVRGWVSGARLGRCHAHRCADSGELFVRVRDSASWLQCPSGQDITVPGYSGTLSCPDAEVLCSPPSSLTGSQAESTTTSAAHTTTTTVSPPHTTDRSDSVYLALMFDDLLTQQLLSPQRASAFSASAMVRVVTVTGVARQRITDDTLMLSDKTVVFVLHPSVQSDDGPLTRDAIEMLNDDIEAGHFVLSVLPEGPVSTATSLRVVESTVVQTTAAPAGLIVTASVCSVVGAIVLAVAACFVIRRCRARTTGDQPSTRA